MTKTRRLTVAIKSEWDIVVARQYGRQLAIHIGFDPVEQARITTVISELARNILLYTLNGNIYLQPVCSNKCQGIHIVACDEGPGIEEIDRVLQDGFSTVGSLGAGLPGVKRMMDEFDIESTKHRGTKVSVIKWLTLCSTPYFSREDF